MDRQLPANLSQRGARTARSQRTEDPQRRRGRLPLIRAAYLMEEEKIPTRADIPDSDKWDLTHLFSDVGKWNEDVEWITRTYPRITEWKGRVAESPQTLAKVLEFEKQLDLKIERVYHFASLQLAEDSAKNDYLSRIGQLQNLMTKLAEASAFVVPEIQAIDNGRLEKFFADQILK